MKIIRTKRELRAELRPARGDGRSIGLVPTMGYLHDGHISLLTAARERCDVVVMSLFVNPTQFQSGEDLQDYPRDEEHDARAATLAGVDLLYVPAAEEIYADGYATSVIVEDLTEVLCGDRSRRGLEHFRGVTTVVAKLFNTAQPDLAFFGQKDAQQAIVVGRMIADLDFPIELVVLPTVREPDGLAMSTRNAYLSPDERRRAPAINASLQAIRAGAEQDQPDLASALDAGRSILTEAGIEPEYLEARDAGDLRPIECFNGRPVLIAIAARLGPARLIDNVVIEPSATKKGGDKETDQR
ncbi:MAG: pantoate--beta-alanine ligase [Solirubrobacterales bacterium]